MKKYPLPPLHLFHTFEAVARRRSFTNAADELCLTQSAVSRQIKQLEDDCGVRLFRRMHRQIELTQEGLTLLGAVTRGLDGLTGSLASFRPAQSYPQITVSASVSFAYFWLMPRLEVFTREHPEVDIRLLASDQRIDLRRDEVDIAVLYGEGSWEGVVTERLFAEKVYPVCSAAYAANHPELETPSDLVGQTLLHLDGGGNLWGAVDWPIWLASQGVTAKPERRGIRLNSYPMVIQAAQAGRGVALGWSYIVDEMVARGQLLRPFGTALETGYGYYVGALENKLSQPAVAAFMQWIKKEFREN